MIIIGAPNVILPIVEQYGSERFMVYNISSNLVNSQIHTLKFQYYIQGLDLSLPNYDDIFARIVFDNEPYFMELMKIVLALRDGWNVALLVYREEDLFDPFTETLAKLIQQRYGYNYQILDQITDFNEWDDSNFDINGTLALDLDSQRYATIIANSNPNAIIQMTEQMDDSHL